MLNTEPSSRQGPGYEVSPQHQMSAFLPSKMPVDRQKCQRLQSVQESLLSWLKYPPTSHHRSLYKWDKQIGEGAFGRVFGAVRKRDGLKVAIKEVEKSKMNLSGEDVPLEVRLNTVSSVSRVGTITFNCRSSSCSRSGTSPGPPPSSTGTRPRTPSTSWWSATQGRTCSTTSPARAASPSLSAGRSSPRWALTSVFSPA